FAGGEVTEEAKKRFLATIPLGRFSTPDDIANASLFLASDEASMVSGSCIEVDGARCV
ncbi:MAG: SDR family oxidoreductase, partial [Proteobacteria bacterium]|nr:SDR family oxidoreductase [Pseudomonadota bacterium]